MTSAPTEFVLLSFEGPDTYSCAGGLGVRVRGLAQELARGHRAHLFFVGDPDLPGVEERDGLVLHRWCQWLSAGRRGGVYDGEEEKVRDWNRSLHPYLVEEVVAPAAAAGRRVVVLAEEWQTAWSLGLLAELLDYRGLRRRCRLLWNANSLFGLERVDFDVLRKAATLTTVSRYMRWRLRAWGVDPIVIPNGVPAAAPPPGPEVAAARAAAAADVFAVKLGRFHPDKGWTAAVTALALLKRRGLRVKLLMRGGGELHGQEVLAHARREGLHVVQEFAPESVSALPALLAAQGEADVVNLIGFLPGALLPVLYAAADFVLANSSHEPFGLVGLEAMAAGGLAVTGSTGEDYALPFCNAVVLETGDPRELAAALLHVRRRPELAASMRERARDTAQARSWRAVAELLRIRLELDEVQQASPT